MTEGQTPAPPWADLAAYRAAFRSRCPLPSRAPALMAARKQWLVWRYEPGETPEKKPRKVPYYVGGGKRSGGQGTDRDRQRLATFSAALEAARRTDMDGVGFAFLPADGLIGVDLDGMIDPDTGEVSARLSGIVQACASYAELSPSGTGVHVICAMPAELAEAWQAEGLPATFKSNAEGVEVFQGRQYFTFTGKPATGGAEVLADITEPVLRRLYVTVKGKPGKAGTDAATDPPAGGTKPPESGTRGANGATPAPVGSRERTLAETVALAEEALGHVSPDEYNQWIKVGHACKASLGTAGYLVWDGWSAGSQKYAGADDTRRRWQTFAPRDIDIGALFAIAEEAGWKSPWAKAKERKRPRKPRPAAAGVSAETPPDATKAAARGGDPPPDMGDGAPPAGPPPDDDWRKWLIYKSRRELSSCLANAELILRHQPDWAGVVAYDEFAERTVFRAPLPFDRDGPGAGEWSDHLDARAAIHMQRQWHVEFSPTTVGQAVEVLARSNRFHPVRDALEALPPWDGIRRNTEWLTDYLGVARTEYSALVGRFFLIGMIKRVMAPGCKFDYCLVLEGEQGLGKSSVARVLAWHWFADTDLDLSNKDSLMALPGHWVYEIAELGGLMKAEERKQKSFLSRQDDEYRPPYGKRMIKAPRQCVFIGTTNEQEYLKDATGGRRFWPVLVTEVNLDGLKAWLPQMLAEALHDYRAGERCWPTPAEQAELFTPEQAKRGMPEPFEDYLYTWVDKQVVPFSMAEAARDCLGLTADKLTPAVVTRIGISLSRLHCVRIEDRNADDPGRRRLYMPPNLAQKQGLAPAANATKASPVPRTEEGRHDWF